MCEKFIFQETPTDHHHYHPTFQKICMPENIFRNLAFTTSAAILSSSPLILKNLNFIIRHKRLSFLHRVCLYRSCHFITPSHHSDKSPKWLPPSDKVIMRQPLFTYSWLFHTEPNEMRTQEGRKSRQG